MTKPNDHFDPTQTGVQSKAVQSEQASGNSTSTNSALLKNKEIKKELIGKFSQLSFLLILTNHISIYVSY